MGFGTAAGADCPAARPTPPAARRPPPGAGPPVRPAGMPWNLHPEAIVSDSFPLAQADDAYQVADAGRSGKIALIP